MLVPSTDTTVEEDLPRLLAEHASVHFTRMSLPTVTPAGLAHMEDSARAAIQMLADIRPDVVLFACTSGSFFQGAEHERELAADLSSIARAPVVTTARAMVEALARRGQRVRLRTPYSDELTALEVAYLEHAGLDRDVVGWSRHRRRPRDRGDRRRTRCERSSAGTMPPMS